MMTDIKHTPLPFKYGVRKDGSIWMSIGDPMRGAHCQFDFYGGEANAAFIARACNSHYELVGVLREFLQAATGDKSIVKSPAFVCDDLSWLVKRATAALAKVSGES